MEYPMKKKELGPALIDTIGKADLTTLVSGVGETILDQFLDSGVLRDIPIFGSLISLTKAGAGIRDALFARKLYDFLKHIHDIPPAQRQEFAARISVDERHRRRVGENLLLLLDKLNDMSKPDMLGRICKAHIEGRIDFETLQRLGNAVERISVYSVPMLQAFYSERSPQPEQSEEILQELAICGLVSIQFSPLIAGGKGGEFGRNELGKLFIEMALNDSA
jgi:hypothetical protein